MFTKNIKITQLVKYGRITVDTSVGDIEFSFCIGDEIDYQIENGQSSYDCLADEDKNRIDDLIMNDLTLI